MDAFFGNNFDNCLTHLNTILERCIAINPVLNWESCHFIVTEGTILGHKISAKGIEVDPAKIEVIENLLLLI